MARAGAANARPRGTGGVGLTGPTGGACWLQPLESARGGCHHSSGTNCNGATSHRLCSDAQLAGLTPFPPGEARIAPVGRTATGRRILRFPCLSSTR